MKTNMCKFFRCFAIFAIAVALLSCNDNRGEEIFDNENQENTDSGKGSESQKDDVLKKISQNVSVKVSAYSNYSWNISITTNLEKVYPNKTIKYGNLCGYNDLPYIYRTYFTLNGNYIKEDVPLFIKYDGSPYVEEHMYWESLVALAKKTSLTESEQLLKVACVTYCDKVESKALAQYWGQVFVEIDGEKYIIKEYCNKRK